jgi:Phage integrase, N-terminal SAM-like domain
MAGRRKGKRVPTSEGVRVFGKAASRRMGGGVRPGGCPGRGDLIVPWARRSRRPSSVGPKRREQAGLDLGGLRTVGRLADWWLHNVYRHAVRRSSWAKAEDRVRRIKETLGDLPVVDLDYKAITEWQAKLSRDLAP